MLISYILQINQESIYPKKHTLKSISKLLYLYILEIFTFYLSLIAFEQ